MNKKETIISLIVDSRITIEDKLFPARKESNSIKGTIRQVPKKLIKDCIILKDKDIIHYITLPWSSFPIETIIQYINIEINNFNIRQDSNLKNLNTQNEV